MANTHILNSSAILVAIVIATLISVGCAVPSTTPVLCKEGWSKPINNTHPSSNGGDDTEQMNTTEIRAFCPPGHVTRVQCQDVNGEYFNVKRGNAGTCEIATGLTCRRNATSNMDCPDYNVQYFCSCPQSSSTATVPATTASGSTPTVQTTTPKRCEKANGCNSSTGMTFDLAVLLCGAVMGLVYCGKDPILV